MNCRDLAFVFSDVSFSYGPQRSVIRDLSLSIPARSVTAILGPNGTGKTTFLHLCLGWLTPISGTITLFGRALTTCGGSYRGRTLSLLPQKEQLHFEYTVLEYVLLGRAPHLRPLEAPGPGDIRIATNSLGTAGILHKGASPLPTLSGGETQLVLLSRSLAQDPSILLLDEPTNHLDLRNRRQMIDLLKRCRDEGKTIVLTTHDPDLASAIADHLILIGGDGSDYGEEEGAGLPFINAGRFDDLFTEEMLSRVYGIPVRILEIEGHRRVLW